MRVRWVVFLFCCVLASCGSRQPMPVVVEPFYDYKDCRIAVGKFSEALAVKDRASLLKTVAAMKEEWAELTAEAMYVAAIRLYDVGCKDDSVYWFYSAQYRAQLVRELLDPQQLNAVGNPATALVRAHDTFLKDAGQYINGYAFGDIEKLLRTVAQVQTEGARLPLLKQLYPNVPFIQQSRWQQVNYQVSAGFSEYMEMVRAKADDLRAIRKATHSDGRF